MTSNIIIDDADNTLNYMINNYKGLKNKREFTELKKRLGPGILNTLSSDNFNAFFPTPPECLLTNDVKPIIEDAHYILEPSAGIGSMIYTAYQINKKADITAFELMSDFSEFLNIKFPQLEIYNDNFLNTDISFLNKIDTVLCNPPFTYGGDKRFYLNFFFKSLFVLANSSKQYTSGGRMVFFCPSEGLEGFIVDKVNFGQELNYTQIIHSKYMTLKKVIEIYNNCNVEYNENELKQFIQLGKKQNRTTYEDENYLDLYEKSLFNFIEPSQIIMSEGCKFGSTGAKVDKYIIYMPYEAGSVNEPLRIQQEEKIDNKKEGVILGKIEDTTGREAKRPQKEIDLERQERNEDYMRGKEEPELEQEFEQGLKELERLNKEIDDRYSEVKKGIDDIKKRHTKGYKPEPEPEPETYSEPEPGPEPYLEPEPKEKKSPNTETKILHLGVSRCHTQIARKHTPTNIYAYNAVDDNNKNQFRKLAYVSRADGEKYYNTSVFFEDIPSDNQIIKYVDNIKLWDKIKITKSGSTYYSASGRCEGEKGYGKGPIERTIILKDSETTPKISEPEPEKQYPVIRGITNKQLNDIDKYIQNKKINSIEKNLDTNIIYNMPPKETGLKEQVDNIMVQLETNLKNKGLDFNKLVAQEMKKEGIPVPTRKTTARKKTTAKKSPAKKTVAKKTTTKTTTVKKTPAKKTPAKKTVAKKTTTKTTTVKKTPAKKTPAKPKVKKLSPSRGKWIPALKEWNKGKDKWCVPKKNSNDHSEVISIAQRMYNASKKN